MHHYKTKEVRSNEIKKNFAITLAFTMICEGGTNLTPSLYSIISNAEGSDQNQILKWNGHIYKFFKNCDTWETAKEYCESLGGHLATISSQEENDAVYDYLLSCGYESAYFGYSDNIEEGSWYWVNDEDISYTNWHSNEPNSENKYEDYAMFYWKFPDGTWNDNDFDESNENEEVFICEWDDENNYVVNTSTDYRVPDIFKKRTRNRCLCFRLHRSRAR